MTGHSNRELLKLMKELSFRHFNRDWQSGLEYILWHWMHHTSPLSSNDKHRLYIIHSRARGWFAVLDEPSEGPQFMTTDKWVRLFQDEFDGATN